MKEHMSSLLRLREHGLKICVDAASVLTPLGLSKLPLLRPDYIKLNMMTYKNMSNDSQRRDDFYEALNLTRQVERR